MPPAPANYVSAGKIPNPALSKPRAPGGRQGAAGSPAGFSKRAPPSTPPPRGTWRYNPCNGHLSRALTDQQPPETDHGPVNNLTAARTGGRYSGRSPGGGGGGSPRPWGPPKPPPPPGPGPSGPPG